ncbi:MAG: UDP-N-acetylglucosamine 2-epimerase (hydrolyzing) [Deltaproteobacteria bacterium]|nr:MAG: UDP-N-acetylglucosamine 2-epimerase (hydrolyzing) [Deltaproteobacteria bacterium]
MRKVCVFIGSRANYSSAKSILRAIQNHKDLELLLVIGAAAILDRYGNIENMILADGFQIDAKMHMIVEGENPTTMAKSTGIGIIDFAMIFSNLKPDIVLVIGDRFEIMAPVIVASYMNIPIAHTMGGEVSGTIDESIRHAITKMSHIHFPANEDARKRIIRLGEDPEMVFNVGCSRIDLVKEYLEANRNGDRINQEEFFSKYKGVGGYFDIEKEKFLLISQHPVTTEYGHNRRYIEETLYALNELKMPCIMIWPNADAGSDEVSKGIRTFRERYRPDWLHLFINLPIDIYVKLMDICACMVGNSSSAIREGSFIGVPAVNIGTRQNGRMMGRNVVHADYDRNDIKEKIVSLLNGGRFEPSTIYGEGNSGEKIANILAELSEIPVQKKIMY